MPLTKGGFILIAIVGDVMKKILEILFFLLLFILTTFSQDRINRGVIPENPTIERLRKVHNPNVDYLKVINVEESLPVKSKNSDWQKALRNQQIEFFDEVGFKSIDTRRTVNKTILSNGFLLVVENRQNWVNSAWENSSKFSYTYDANNNLTEMLYQFWDGSAWVNNNKDTYEYDGNNNIIELLIQYWVGSVWENSMQYSYTYDAKNNLTESLGQSWNGFAWVIRGKYSYTYDINNNKIEQLYEEWNGFDWVNDYKSSYTYDANNNKTEALYQDWNDSAWVSIDRYSFTYDGNNYLIETLIQNWDGSFWANYRNLIYSYDANNSLIELLRQDWDGYTWVNEYKSTYTYDANINLTEQLDQAWIGSFWENNIEYSFTYDENNNLSKSFVQIWDSSGWVNYGKYLYTYTPVTAVNGDLSSVNAYSLSNNYPNPFNPTTVISYQLPVSCNVTLRIYDILGKEVATLVDEYKPAGTYEVEFSTTGGPASSTKYPASGIYFYRMQAGDFVQTRKMLLLK